MPASPSRGPRVCALLALALSTPLFAQVPAATAPSASGFTATPAAPATPPSLLITSPATAPAALPEITVAQPFVGTITADRVYVRAGPGTTYYELGQVSKGDAVYVVGALKGWYKILPPNGTFCLIAKDLVEVDAAGTAGTVKADYVNVRAGTAINPNRDPFAVLTVVRKGTKLRVVGSNEKFYQVAPPEGAHVYISPQFVHQTTGGVGDYKVPELKLPAGATGPTNTVTAPTTPPTGATTPPVATIDIPERPSNTAGPEQTGTLIPSAGNTNTNPASQGVTGTPGNSSPSTQPAPLPPAQPAVVYSQSATQKFNDLNKRYQAELQKPLPERDVDGLLKEYKDLQKEPNLAPSVKMGTESRIDALEKIAAIQRMAKENAASDQTLAQQREALQQQYASAEKMIADYQRSSPFVAEGTLQSSTIVKGKYALVNPSTGRVIAYVDPQGDVDISTLVGKYVGLRGTSVKQDNSDITVIKVASATLLPAPVQPPKP